MKQELAPGQKAAYLANVLSISKPVEEMVETEKTVMQEIISRIEADLSDLEQAKRLVSRQPYSIRSMRSPSARRDNVEDMVTMALADGELTKRETDPIEKLTDLLGFSQADLDILVRRAETRLHKIRNKSAPSVPPPPPPLPEPPADITPPQAAVPIPHEIVPQEEALPPAPTVPTQEAPKPIAPSSPPPPTKLEQPKPKPATKTEVVEKKERPSPPRETSPDREITLESCRKCREQSTHPREYCFGCGSDKINPWGCRLLKMDWTPGANWLLNGHFRNDRIFEFDHLEIGAQMNNAAKKVEKCPYFNLSIAEAALSRFPRRANVYGHWRYREAGRHDTRTHEVTVPHYTQGHMLTSRRKVLGLEPRGINDAIKMIMLATRSSNHKLDTGLIRNKSKTQTSG